jgi:UDP-N-acetylmuramyl pentapeptide phosphotransferase/UDP-N-acetylglucosamine-1-phosphate transferase
MTLKPIAKITAQTITASLIFFTLNIRVTSLYELSGGEHFSGLFSFLATLLTVIVITNSLNLIDGIDGLAGVLSLISILVFGTWFFFTENYPFAMVCFGLGGGILAFLFQNWEPSKIFMGDTGSLVIGTLLSIVTIQFMNDNFELPSQNEAKFSSSIGSAIAIIIIPLVDTARIIIIRFSKKLSPFKADKRHIHHALVRIGLSHRQVVYILALGLVDK